MSSRIMDHRNESFSAKDAHYEDVAGKGKAINRQIISKVGLKEYSKEEIIEKCGPVVEYNYNNRYSWEEFEAMPKINRREYISHLVTKYQGLRIMDLGAMFGKTNEQIKPLLFETKIHFPKGGARYMTVGRKQFYKDMFPEVKEEPKQAPEGNYILEQKPEKEVEYEIEKLRFSCDVEDVNYILEKMGVKGTVLITVVPYARPVRYPSYNRNRVDYANYKRGDD